MALCLEIPIPNSCFLDKSFLNIFLFYFYLSVFVHVFVGIGVDLCTPAFSDGVVMVAECKAAKYVGSTTQLFGLFVFTCTTMTER